jgi:hypothetical protein
MLLSDLRIMALLIALCAAAPTTHAANGCDAPLMAMNKLWRAPSHQYLTETGGYNGGKTRNSEIITMADARYLLMAGKWHHSAMSQQEAAEEIASNRENVAKDVCRYLRDESVGGESAALYSTHHQTEDDTSDTQIWISKKNGLPLRMEIDIDVGGGAMGKTHNSFRVDYSHVTAPAGVP